MKPPSPDAQSTVDSRLRVQYAGPVAKAILLLAVAGCGHGSAERPSAAEVRAYHYQDSSGLLVGTYGGAVRQRLPGRTSVEARALADYVRIDPDRGFDPSDPTADRRAPDAVTSASATAGGGEVAEEWRFEGLLGFDVEREVRGAPASIGAVVRASTEPDYRSVSVAARASAELFERNTGVSVLFGYGRDRVLPVEVFGGQEALWPASHDRWAGTASISQLLSPALVLTAGVAATWQRGMLSSPYRRALVYPTLLLPEALPRARDRYSGFVALSASLTPRLALHVQQGAYLDDWSVRAFIPAAVLAAEVDEGILLQLGYRFYAQSRASFYAAVYPEPRPIMAGDVRLGRVHDHHVSLELRRALRQSGRLKLPLLAGYQLSVMDYRSVGSRVVSHVFMLGLAADY
jgi:hypothetical protein